jgi:hypothetical protein
MRINKGQGKRSKSMKRLKVKSLAKLQAQTNWIVADYDDCSFCNNCSAHTETELNTDLDVHICKACLAVKEIEIVKATVC